MNIGDTVKIVHSGGRIGKIAGFGVMVDEETGKYQEAVIVELSEKSRFFSPDNKTFIRMMLSHPSNLEFIQLPQTVTA